MVQLILCKHIINPTFHPFVSAAVCSKVVVLLLLIHCLQMLLLWWFCVMSMVRCAVLCVLSTFAKIVMGKIGWLLYFDFLPDIFSMFSCVFCHCPLVCDSVFS